MNKIKVNENLTNIINFIHSRTVPVTWFDLVQYCIDYDLYKELYLNHFLISKLLDEKNIELYLTDKKEKETEKEVF